MVWSLAGAVGSCWQAASRMAVNTASVRRGGCRVVDPPRSTLVRLLRPCYDDWGGSCSTDCDVLCAASTPHASASAGSFDARCPALALNTWPGGHQHHRVFWSACPARRATGDDPGAGEPVSTRTAVAARGSAGRWSARRLGFPAPLAA